ncbi:hypothetical protein K502DRAFT_362588 [Neoconidiobolus thromboides FSU 785]|nr:hypothetical protein K502DRAFT_362588 [Neoconidiobolus thromboides FSU 785]
MSSTTLNNTTSTTTVNNNSNATQTKQTVHNIDFQDCNKLSQCLLSGAYFIFYGYYILQHPIYANQPVGLLQRTNQFISLLTFLFSLMVSDSDTIYKAIPNCWTTLTSIPGLQECFSLLFAIIWMVASIIWFINYPVAPLEPNQLSTICALNVPFILTTLSALNWFSWTVSFMV